MILARHPGLSEGSVTPTLRAGRGSGGPERTLGVGDRATAGHDDVGVGRSGGLSLAGRATEIWYSVGSPASLGSPASTFLTSQPWAMTWPSTGRTYSVITLDVPSG